jgi:hypothetical protein
MASRSVTVVLKNATADEMLVTSSSSLAWGDWDVAPAFSGVPPGFLEAFTSQSDGAGTQGTLQLTLASDPSGIVTINWDNPYAGSNSYSGTAPPPYKISYQGGIGDNAIVVFTFSK